LIKSFYSVLKTYNKIIKCCFIVGVLPTALADISGVFNIFTDITFDLSKYYI